jgi:hypothetical protein
MFDSLQLVKAVRDRTGGVGRHRCQDEGHDDGEQHG